MSTLFQSFQSSIFRKSTRGRSEVVEDETVFIASWANAAEASELAKKKAITVSLVSIDLIR